MNNTTNNENLSNSAEEKIEKARANVIKIVKTRFTNIPEQVIQTINSIDDVSVLEQLFTNSIVVADFEDFQKVLQEYISRK